MRKTLAKVSSILTASLSLVSNAYCDTVEPSMRLVVSSYEFIDNFSADEPDPFTCDFWPEFCSDLQSVRGFHYKTPSVYIQNTVANYRNGRPSCNKIIYWYPKNVSVLSDGTITRALGTYTEKCGSLPLTKGITNEKPSALHQQAIGPAPSLPIATTWEGKIVTGNDKLTFNSQTMIKYDGIVSNLYYIKPVRYAIGGQQGAIGGPSSIPAGINCSNFSVGSSRLVDADMTNPADLEFGNRMKAVFGQPLLCKGMANLWEGDAKGFNVTPIAQTSNTRSQVFHYRVELAGAARLAK